MFRTLCSTCTTLYTEIFVDMCNVIFYMDRIVFTGLLTQAAGNTAFCTCVHNLLSFIVRTTLNKVFTLIRNEFDQFFRTGSVLNLPGIGKSMTFVTIGMTKEGKRILEFDHDPTRQHSPIIHQMEKIYIKENKSIWQYMLQLQEMGEKKEEYASLWKYMEGETEHRFPLYNYPDPGFRITEKYSHLSVVGNKSIC